MKRVYRQAVGDVTAIPGITLDSHAKAAPASAVPDKSGLPGAAFTKPFTNSFTKPFTNSFANRAPLT